MKVLMFPALEAMSGEESGVRRVVESYYKYAREFDIEFINVPPDEEDAYDLMAVHAGMTDRHPRRKPMVAICHGLYWTADYQSNNWEYRTNAKVIDVLRIADAISVPSPWVAETIMRDMRVIPWVIPHGIDYRDWEHNRPNKGYVLWNKNRIGDVCTPVPLVELARERPAVSFITTFTSHDATSNVSPMGIIPHAEMKVLVQEAGVYLSTTKETFGIGVLEAMASGVPVLGFNHGGNTSLVQHGQTGYLAKPGNYADLARGLDYCLKYRDVLSENSRIAAKQFTWENSMTILREFFVSAIEKWKANQLPLQLPEGAWRVK